MASQLTDSQAEQNYDFFLVLDFEATCDKNRKIHPQVSLTFFSSSKNNRQIKRQVNICEIKRVYRSIVLTGDYLLRNSIS